MGENLPFDLDALLMFGKVVECRSLTKAAQRLGVPKSTVSRKLSKLESDLGIKLLRKNTHQLTFTDLGEQIYARSRTILAEVDAVRQLVEGSKREPQGLLRVALPMFMGVDYASTVGATFLRRYPKARLEIRLVDSSVHPIKDGYDVALGVGPLQDSTLIAKKVFTLEMFLCAAPAMKPVRSVAELSEVPFVDSGFYGEPRKLVLRQGGSRHEVQPQARACANNFQVGKQFILQGLGVGAMPKQILCAEELRAGTLVPVLPDWELEPVEVSMIFPFQLSHSNLVSAFHEIAVELVSQNIARGSKSATASSTIASPDA